jgi:hypothetical protein
VQAAWGRQGGHAAAGNMSPAAGKARAQLAANTRWSKVADRAQHTRPAFTAQQTAIYDAAAKAAEAEGVVDPDLVHRMANAAVAAHMAKMRLAALAAAARLAAQDGEAS